jgi:nucleotidyltransferase/DNA polymerase involved in DNA repair
VFARRLTMKKVITDIPGIGPSTAKILGERGFKTAKAIAGTTVKKLSRVPGFGALRAGTVIKAAKQLIAATATRKVDRVKSDQKKKQKQEKLRKEKLKKEKLKKEKQKKEKLRKAKLRKEKQKKEKLRKEKLKKAKPKKAKPKKGKSKQKRKK